MGESPFHASKVGLVRNFRTVNVSLQFHLLYDDHFDTVVPRPDEESKVWQELLVFKRFKSEYDDEDYVPQL